MIAGALVAGVVGLLLAREVRLARRRARLTAERLHWLAQRDERAARSTLRPRTGEVVIQPSPNGHR